MQLQGSGRMSVTMSKSESATVFTVTADPKSSLPPICQILKNLCYSPVCCSVSRTLRRVQGGSQSTLGVLQILVGLLNIGLGTILIISGVGSWWQMDEYGFPYWLGGLFMLFGIFCILSHRFPSPCLVIINVLLSLCGVAFAITAIVLYSINMAQIGFWGFCNPDYYYRYRSEDMQPSPTPPSAMKENCLRAWSVLVMVLHGVNALLIILSALQLCLSISSSVLGIKALRKRENPEEKADFDPEIYSPLLEDKDDCTA